MTQDLVSDVGRSSDLFVLAGDLNTSPEEFPFQLLGDIISDLEMETNLSAFSPPLESMTGLHNCHNHNKARHSNSSLDSTEFATHGHSENTYTGNHFATPKTKQKNRNRDYSIGKQIDFILYKLISKRGCDRTLECHEISSNEKNFQCFAERIQCLSKDPFTGLSFSDHQPVAVRFKISNSHSCSRMSGDSNTIPLNFSMYGDHSLDLDSPANSLNHLDQVNSGTVINQEITNLYLKRALKLMKYYMNQNKVSKQRLTYSFGILSLALILFMSIAFYFYKILSFLTLCFSSFVVLLLLIIVIVIIEIVYRYEQHGIWTVIDLFGEHRSLEGKL